MKTISDAAMAAIEAGTAIVTGALEIIPQAGTLLPDLVEEGTVVTVDWFQNTFIQTGGNDEARMGISFLDFGGDDIGTVTWAAYSQPTTWTARSISANAPADCYGIRIWQDHRRIAGSHDDGYIDAIALTVDGVARTVVNPGAEAGTAGWKPTVGALDVWNPGAGDPGTPVPYAGSYYFAGGTTAQATAYQDFITYSAEAPADPIRVWGGYGPRTIDGEVYQGIGDRGLAQQSAGAIGGVAQGLTLGLTGIAPELVEVLDADEVKSASVVLRRLIFAGDGKTMLDHEVWDRGRVDTVTVEETIGGTATVRMAVESAARGLGRSGARQRADADQRLINPTDGYFKFAAYAGEKKLYWGGRKPSRVR